MPHASRPRLLHLMWSALVVCALVGCTAAPVLSNSANPSPPAATAASSTSTSSAATQSTSLATTEGQQGRPTSAAQLANSAIATLQTPIKVRQFATLSVQDQGGYIQLLLIRAEKILRDHGRADLADQTYNLFVTRITGDQTSIGITQFNQNIALLKDLDIEDVFEKTLVDSGIGVQIDPNKPNLIGLPDDFFAPGTYTLRCPPNPTLTRLPPTETCSYAAAQQPLPPPTATPHTRLPANAEVDTRYATAVALATAHPSHTPYVTSLRGPMTVAYWRGVLDANEQNQYMVLLVRGAEAVLKKNRTLGGPGSIDASMFPGNGQHSNTLDHWLILLRDAPEISTVLEHFETVLTQDLKITIPPIALFVYATRYDEPCLKRLVEVTAIFVDDDGVPNCDE